MLVSFSHTVRQRQLSDKIMLIIFPYLHGITWATGPFFGWGEYGYTPYGTACSLFWHMRNLSFLVSACICCLAVPVGIMVFSYLKIIQKKNKSDRTMVKRKRGREKRSSNLTMVRSMLVLTSLAWMTNSRDHMTHIYISPLLLLYGCLKKIVSTDI